MTKQEFLNSLRAALTGELGAAAAESHVQYYEEYINAHIRLGRSEEEVLQELGNPRLIARSIIDADKNADRNTDRNTEQSYREQNDYESAGHGRLRVHKLPTWLVVLLTVVIMLLVMALVIMFVWWLAPIILMVWLVVAVVRAFTKR